MDSSIEVSKDFVVIYFFKLKNAVRPKVRYVCTIAGSLNGGWPCCFHSMYLSRSSRYFYLLCLVITGSPTLTLKVSFF